MTGAAAGSGEEGQQAEAAASEGAPPAQAPAVVQRDEPRQQEEQHRSLRRDSGASSGEESRGAAETASAPAGDTSHTPAPAAPQAAAAKGAAPATGPPPQPHADGGSSTSSAQQATAAAAGGGQWVSSDHVNLSPDPSLLLAGGFQTPATTFFVRSHGGVPRLTWEGHRLAVGGLVERPMEFTMDALSSSFPAATVTSYTACVGARRTEVKAAFPGRATRGVDLSSTAVGNSTWTGVRLADVLRACGAASPGVGAAFVHFGGPEGEYPEPGLRYVTSLELARCLDPSPDILLAWEQNGRQGMGARRAISQRRAGRAHTQRLNWMPLDPSHGFPLRLVAPGIIGGRAVKWLSSVEVAAQETNNYYHIHDNRVLPSGVDEATAEAEGWFDPAKPRLATSYAARESPVNSAILAPGHGEIVREGGCAVAIRGWAGSGGGHGISMVEVSLDGGASWRLARLTHSAPPTESGRVWSWYLWQLDVAADKLLGAEEIRCRALDTALNTQPERARWNLLGAANNAHSVVRLRPLPPGDDAAAAGGGRAVRAVHPALAAEAGRIEGWMAEEAAEKGVQRPTTTAAEEEAEARAGKAWEQLPVISLGEVQRHNSREAGVYDPTKFLDQHPGGADVILGSAGGDASAVFDSVHPQHAKLMAVDYLIGRLEGAARPLPRERRAKQPAQSRHAGAAADDDDAALVPGERRAFLLAEKINVSHDTRLFRFALPSPHHRLGLPVGRHILAAAHIAGEEVVRPYTPTTLDCVRGHFDLVVKVYPPAPPKYPTGGKMSQHLDSLTPGRDWLEVEGPAGAVTYLGRGAFDVAGRRVEAGRLNLIAGGTGITPMYQLAQAILSDPSDPTEMRLLFANKTPEDILLEPELNALAAGSGGRLQARVFYTVDAGAGPGWRGFTGHVDARVAAAALFPPSAGPGGAPRAAALLCGPPPMIARACRPALREMGFEDAAVVEF
ncbi:hypothetical protein Rsub_07729 [Raphidocelis subcapitata]|uniref:Nitrate reductase n=1 Tax=Raphidocelis subcapitata TaxID=307507 RepID=A0A2V0PDH0_9CHLO|nr:hypothetical protein Rsub_07729 [Raphidocelis subcapitata]|eukprot:GBF95145.1 hypothetical protein Rsub_07729 [Raphidocelis subcapitata]